MSALHCPYCGCDSVQFVDITDMRGTVVGERTTCCYCHAFRDCLWRMQGGKRIGKALPWIQPSSIDDGGMKKREGTAV